MGALKIPPSGHNGRGILYGGTPAKPTTIILPLGGVPAKPGREVGIVYCSSRSVLWIHRNTRPTASGSPRHGRGILYGECGVTHHNNSPLGGSTGEAGEGGEKNIAFYHYIPYVLCMHDYNKQLKSFARANRKAGNLSEALLWNELKQRKMGVQFKRQRPIGNYIADFYCLEKKIWLLKLTVGHMTINMNTTKNVTNI